MTNKAEAGPLLPHLVLSRRHAIGIGVGSWALLLGGCSSSKDSGTPRVEPIPRASTTGPTTSVGVSSTSTSRPEITSEPLTKLDVRVQSLYVPAVDGVRLAVDVWLPTKLSTAERLPTVLRATRYGRAEMPATNQLADESNFAQGEFWNDAGYALVIVDARGSGASFGSRATELSDIEIRDYGRVLDWIAGQPWSNGRVGMYGASYDGNTADLTSRLGNAHLTAVLPRFSDFDSYRHLVYPGGAYLEQALGRWIGANQILDGVDGAVDVFASLLGIAVADAAALFTPVKPVDGPAGSDLLQQARVEHQSNGDLAGTLPLVEFRDDTIDGYGWSTGAIPTWRSDIEQAAVPVLVQVGWWDAGTAAGALVRFATFETPQTVIIGPWNHGGRQMIDPLLDLDAGADALFAGTSQPEQLEERLGFVDLHVKGDRGAPTRRSLQYSVAGEDQWHTSESWPIPGTTTQRWFLGPGTLTKEPPINQSSLPYRVDPGVGTGESNRWAGNLLGSDILYADRTEVDSRLLTFDSPLLTQPMRLVGFPIVNLALATDGTDGLVIAYLSVIDADDVVRYVSEGQLRFLHRAVNGEGRGLGVPRTYSRSDQLPVTPHETMTLEFELLPAAIRLSPDHRLRVSLAGHDKDCFRRYGTDPETWTISTGENLSWLDLPVLAI